MQYDKDVQQPRILARQFAREITAEELSIVGGGVKHTCDLGDPTGSTCAASDGNPCDQDTWSTE